jgi:hypothetical protein
VERIQQDAKAIALKVSSAGARQNKDRVKYRKTMFDCYGRCGQKRRIAMAQEYTFSTKHYPVNDLLELDLQNHLDQMAEFGWTLVGTQHLVPTHGETTPQMILFWSKDK